MNTGIWGKRNGDTGLYLNLLALMEPGVKIGKTGVGVCVRERERGVGSVSLVRSGEFLVRHNLFAMPIR